MSTPTNIETLAESLYVPHLEGKFHYLQLDRQKRDDKYRIISGEATQSSTLAVESFRFTRKYPVYGSIGFADVEIVEDDFPLSDDGQQILKVTHFGIEQNHRGHGEGLNLLLATIYLANQFDCESYAIQDTNTGSEQLGRTRLGMDETYEDRSGIFCLWRPLDESYDTIAERAGIFISRKFEQVKDVVFDPDYDSLCDEIGCDPDDLLLIDDSI